VLHRGRISAIPSIDGLAGVADAEQVSRVSGPGIEKSNLRSIRVLKLIDVDVGKFPTLRGGEVGVMVNDVGEGGEQVVEVEESAPFAFGLVACIPLCDRVEVDDRCAARTCSFDGISIRGDHASLGPFDFAGHREEEISTI